MTYELLLVQRDDNGNRIGPTEKLIVEAPGMLSAISDVQSSRTSDWWVISAREIRAA